MSILFKLKSIRKNRMLAVYTSLASQLQMEFNSKINLRTLLVAERFLLCKRSVTRQLFKELRSNQVRWFNFLASKSGPNHASNFQFKTQAVEWKV